MSSEDGNAVPKERPQKAPRVFAPGDVVALTQSALRMPKLQAMSCRLIYSIGLPNEFLVKSIYEDPDDGVCLKLFPCCDTQVDRKTDEFRCEGHPTIYFQKVNYRRLPKAGDKMASIVLPLIGEIFRSEYQDDEKNPKFITRLFGMEGSIQGSLAKMAKEFAENCKTL